MLESVLAVLTGGATGLLGTAFSFAADYFKERQRHAQEVALRHIDLEITRSEAASAERVAAVEAESVSERAQWSALEASYRNAGARWSRGDSGWLVAVDVVRGLTRPVLTWIFVGLTGALYWSIADSVVIAEEMAMRARIVDTVLYLATTCVLWWFGARQLAKRADPRP